MSSWLCGGVLFEGAVDLSGEVSFEGSECLPVGVAGCPSVFDVVGGGLVVGELGADRGFQDAVHLPVAASVVSVVLVSA